MGTNTDLAAIQEEISRAVTNGDRQTLARHIAPDVVWNGGAAEGGLDGIDMFFSAVERFQTLYTSWEVIPQVILVRDRVVMVHQIDRVTLPDGTSRDLRFNLYVEYNDADQIQRVWEYGGNAPIDH
jgi:ketosteroid isomerase-like protein